MNADRAEFPHAQFPHGDLTRLVIGAFFATYNELGHGFLESVYENALAIQLETSRLRVRQQVPIEVRFRGHTVGEYRADMLVENALIVEIKASSRLMPMHDAQVLNYLKATGVQVGLLLNFGPRPQFKRLVFS